MSTSFCYVFIFEKCTCITQFGNDNLSLELSFLTVEFFYVKCYVAESRSHHRKNYTHVTDYAVSVRTETPQKMTPKVRLMSEPW